MAFVKALKMTVFIVSYDLNIPGQDYPPLIAELRRVGGAKLLKSAWIINVNQTASEVLSAVKTYVDSNDSVIVFEITYEADWAVRNVSVGAFSFLRKYIP
jgi:hypothetical protein